MKVDIEHREPTHVAFMRHLGPYDEVGANCVRRRASRFII